MFRFSGGVHPPYSKLTKRGKIEIAKLPKKVILPLRQHIGAPCKPLVRIGEHVKVGQKIADNDAFVSAPIHASISGRVTEIGEKPHPVLGKCKAIVIESDGKVDWFDEHKKIDPSSIDNLRKIIKEAGIVGLGGAAFPTHVKLSPPEGTIIDTIILNGAECEPYLTCDHILMIAKPEDILKGFLIIKKILNAKKAIVGIEDNKANAIHFIKEVIADKKLGIEVISLPTKYPEGAEKQLIYALTGRKVPPGGLPKDVGVVVQNVQTAKAVYDAVVENKPLVDRVVTVTGAVKEPKNLLVKIGTPFKDLIEQCGGALGDVGKIISGGPMMGIAQSTDEVPVIKGTSGILVQLMADINLEEEQDCIRCSKCVDVCPMFLMPTMIATYSKKKMIDRAEEYNPLDCFECGCCDYACPCKIPLLKYIKKAKEEIIAKTKK
jgi:electron transport complex protein RnfC